MASENRVSTPCHEWISLRLVLQTVGIYALLVAVAIRLAHSPLFWPRLLLIPIWFAIGVWLDRMYTVAHEGVHRKLFPEQRFLNDTISTLLLIPICAPFSLFRRIHFFHHSANRRDPATAALADAVEDHQIRGAFAVEPPHKPFDFAGRVRAV